MELTCSDTKIMEGWIDAESSRTSWTHANAVFTHWRCHRVITQGEEKLISLNIGREEIFIY